MIAEQRRLALLFLRLMAVARYRFIAELVMWFLGVWWCCAVAIFLLEAGHNPRIHSLGDAVYALLVTMTTSGDSAVAPLSAAGRWVMAVAVLASKLLTALLCALAAAVLIERKVREDMGLKMFDFNDHVVLIGWNLKGPHILAALRQDPVMGHKHVVIMSDGEARPSDDPLAHWSRSSLPIRGECLERANLAKASSIVVLANYAEKHNADALSAINCLMARQLNPSAPITVELLDPSQRPYLEAAGATDIVAVGEVGGFLLAEAAVGGVQTREFLVGLKRRAQARTERSAAASTAPASGAQSQVKSISPAR